MDMSVAWMNSAETNVTLKELVNPATNATAIKGNFMSTGGQFEFFLWGTLNGPKVN